MSADQTVKEQVLAELAWEPMVDADGIVVSVRDGVATLTGHVESYWQMRAAEVAAARVKGVKAVSGLTDVRLPPDARHDDDAVAATAAARLASDGAVPEGAVAVQVEDGLVTLSGTVTHHFQRVAAALAVQQIRGVIGVDNKIAIALAAKKPLRPDQIRDDIRRALNRGWFAADTVHVAAQGGTVTLSGSAETLRDRDLAVATAWAAPGTATVENRIRIS